MKLPQRLLPRSWRSNGPWRNVAEYTVDRCVFGGVISHHAAAVEYPALILMGNEQAGLTDTLAAACDVNVKIPMRGRADSLNLAVATGIMLYAVTDKA